MNYVNAPSIAEDSGIQVKEASTKSAGNYLNLLEVKLSTDERSYTVSGTLISDEIFRLVEVDGYQMALKPTAYILLTPHHDRPGMIAQVATLLGEENINISALQVARKGPEAGGESVMVFNLDNPLSDVLLAKIRKLEGIYGSLFIML